MDVALLSGVYHIHQDNKAVIGGSKTVADTPRCPCDQIIWGDEYMNIWEQLVLFTERFARGRVRKGDLTRLSCMLLVLHLSA